ENASATVATLQGSTIQIQLSQGLAEYSVIQGNEAGAEIDTPNVAVIPRRVGLYRIEVTPSGDTLVTVREGDADISTPDGSTPLPLHLPTAAGRCIGARGRRCAARDPTSATKSPPRRETMSSIVSAWNEISRWPRRPAAIATPMNTTQVLPISMPTVAGMTFR